MKLTLFDTQRHDLPLCFRPPPALKRTSSDQAGEFGEGCHPRQPQVDGIVGNYAVIFMVEPGFDRTTNDDPFQAPLGRLRLGNFGLRLVLTQAHLDSDTG
jgi:hypothetical protein